MHNMKQTIQLQTLFKLILTKQHKNQYLSLKKQQKSLHKSQKSVKKSKAIQINQGMIVQQPNHDMCSSATDIYKQAKSYTILNPIQKQQKDRIAIGNEGSPAVIIQQKSFLKLAPLYLWLAFKQPHIVYYIVQSILEYFKFCEVDGQIIDISILVFLILVCIALEIYAMYTTYCNYTHGNQEEDSYKDYLTWNQAKNQWEATQLSSLKEGQIVLVKKYVEGNLLTNPTNLLPIAYASGSRHILIKTTRIDKRQEYRKVNILLGFKDLIKMPDSYDKIIFNPLLFKVNIVYSFLSYLGQTFEATVILPNAETGQNRYVINNEDMIPSGIGISTENFVIGIILKQVSGSSFKNAQKILLKKNSISQTLQSYLFASIWINLSLMVVTYIINLLLTELSTSLGRNLGAYSYCYAINFAAVFMNTIYISMHILLYIHRFYDVWFNRRATKINCQNRIRTIDELAQTDTLIMDDFFFLERPINTDDFKYKMNQEAPLHQHFDVILKVMQQSLLLQQHMSGHVIPILKYYRLLHISNQKNKGKRMKILKQEAKSQSLVQIKIKVTIWGVQNLFMLRFNDNPVKSSIKKLREGFKKDIQVIAQEHERNLSSLLLFIEIMKLDADLTISNKYYVLYGLISFNETFDERSVQMLKQEAILSRFNIVIMTNKNKKYIEHFMGLSGMITKRQADDNIILLDETEEGQIDQTIRDYKKLFKDRRIISKQNTKEAILLLNSNMITYLSRKNIRQSFLKLTPYCKYILFYNCSQFQKQICAASLFKIYPCHIYLSNYICDYSIFQWSNLSIAQQGASSQMLVTFVVPKYECIKHLILSQAMKSVQIVQIIVNSHIFKNQFFLGANLVSFYLVFQGSTINTLMAYLGQIMFFFNFVFTLGPIFYIMFKRPDIFIEQGMQKYINIHRTVYYNINALVFGIISAFVAYALVVEQFVPNLFTSVLVMSVVAGNFFVLFLDDSKNKAGQVFWVLVQLVFSCFFIIMIQLFQTKNFKFIGLGTNFAASNIWFYVSTFVILPFLVIIVLAAFAAGKDIRLIQNQKEMGLREYQQRLIATDQSQMSVETQAVEGESGIIVVKVGIGVGKGLRMEQENVSIN